MINLFALLFFISISYANDKEECKPISIGEVDLCVELALTKAEKAKGLMYRRKLTDTDGMLFIWKKEEKRCMWMKNTFIPLDLGFFREDMSLIEMKNLFPKSTKSVCSSEPAKYALELPKDWFLKNKIRNNAKLSLN